MKLKKITLMSMLMFFLLMLPVLYLSFANRASGDDYGYGIYTRGAWMSSHSFAALSRAIGQTIEQYYSGWQGTWFSVLVFSLQPEVFSDRAYVLVAFLMLLLWSGSTFYLFHEILCGIIRLDKWEYLLVSIWFLKREKRIFCNGKAVFDSKYSLILAVMLFCLYSAMQAPAIYAGVDVSGGVYNMNFQVFLLIATGILLIMAGNLAKFIKARWEDAAVNNICKSVLICSILFSLCWVIVFRSNIKTSTSYVCLRYIASGEAKDYKEQMELQTLLMEAEQTRDVVVPFINDVQGPLMHMPVTDEPDAWTNMVTADFYGKDSVVAMERPRWMELYGKE